MRTSLKLHTIRIAVIILCITSFLYAQDNTAPQQNQIPRPPALTEEEEALKKLVVERDTIAAQNIIHAEKQKQALTELNDKIMEIQIQNKISEEQLKLELDAIRIETQKLAMQNALDAEKHKKALAQIKTENEIMAAEMEKEQKQVQQTLQKLALEKDKISLENALAAEKQKKAVAELMASNELLSVEIETARKNLEKELQTLANEKAKVTSQIEKFQAENKLREQKDSWLSEVHSDIQYVKEPFKDGVLTISDRRILLNGVIHTGSADYVTERIHYFNNQSKEYPIFMVIDSSPGGSIMAGFRILKAMEESDAPVYVVVKSFAASMAACITTLAEKSYAYPNAIILHHQPSSGMQGNLRQAEEYLEVFQEWGRRTMDPISKKMGISSKEFVKKMYENNSDGDWEEFADQAKKLKWVDNIVEEIKEQSFRKKPSDPEELDFFFLRKPGVPATEEEAKIKLPPLQPFDFYFMYNPDDRYVW